jgi:Protein of unknown function (DUF4231)
MFWKHGPAKQAVVSPPMEVANNVVASIGKKADKNKRNARRATIGLAAITASIPVLIGLSSTFFWGRVLPSVLAAVAAVGTAWVHVERPHERWSLYRRYHRLVEMDRLLYVNEVSPYDGPDRDRILIETLAERQLNLHDEWAGLLPRTADVAGLGPAGTARGNP